MYGQLAQTAAGLDWLQRCADLPAPPHTANGDQSQSTACERNLRQLCGVHHRTVQALWRQENQFAIQYFDLQIKMVNIP